MVPKLTATELLARVQAARHAREEARRLAAEAQVALAEAVRLLSAWGLSTRDAAELLGVSHQRVHQLRQKEAT